MNLSADWRINNMDYLDLIDKGDIPYGEYV